MTCRGERRRLVALVHGGLSDRAAKRLRAHLDGCPACREAFAKLNRARATLDQLREEPLPEINDRQVEAQIRWRLAHRHAPEGRLQVRSGLAIAALSATLCVGGIVGALLNHAYAPARVERRPTPAKAPPRLLERPKIELAALPTVIGGEVLVADVDGRIGPLRIDRPLLQGERVITQSGEIALQWEVGRGLRLQPNSEIRLSRLDDQGQHLVLLRGRIDVEIAKNGAPFSVSGGGIRTEVKGTCFGVSLRDHETTVSVYRGLVSVSPSARGADKRGAAVDVSAGRLLRAVAGAAPVVVSLDPAEGPPAFNLQHPWPSVPHLLAMTGKLRVESRPPGVEVRFDTVPLGRTDLTIRGSVGRHLVELWRDDELLSRQWVEVGSAAMAHLTVNARRPARTERLPPHLYDVFRRRAVIIRGCYERQLKRTPDLAGRIVVRVAIDSSGKVTEANLDSDTIPDPQVGRCALAAIQKWRFPAGQAAEVIYPFLFRPN